MTEFREISDRAEDLAVLECFYNELYISEFPDADERESLDNMKQYLRLRGQGWYGKNNYHIVIALEDGRPCGGAISDYLADANAGMIEFLVVGQQQRGVGLGHALLSHTEQALTTDAKATGKELFCVAAEMNDPFKPGALDDCFDPFVRALIWQRWGYGRLDFPYLQPALSSGQRGVSHLMLIAKLFRSPAQRMVPGSTVKAMLAGYMRWAMRIEKPEEAFEYQEAARYIDKEPSIALAPLGAYVGADACLPMSINEITGPADRDLARVLNVYASAFPGGPSEITPDALRDAATQRRGADARYHLWAVRATPSKTVEGVASFFTFPTAGFGGYVALSGELKETRRLPLLLARIEEQMLRDRIGARGWYIECVAARAALFAKFGFRNIDIEYRQPPLDATGELATSPILCLMYKEFGRQFSEPLLKPEEFLASLRSIFAQVYQIADPPSSPSYQYLQQQLVALEMLRFR